MKYLKRINANEPAPPWGLVTAIVTPIAGFICILIGITIAGLILPQAMSRFVVGYSFGMILLAAYLGFTRNRTPKDRDALGFGPYNGTPLLIIFILSIGVAILIDIIGLAVVGTTLPVPELFAYFDVATNAVVSLRPSIIDWIFAFMLMGLFQPIAEELAFRGVVFPALKRSLGGWGGYLITSIFYAVFHLLAYAPPGNSSPVIVWFTLVVPFLDALFITLVRANTRSTRAAVVAHAGIGIFAVMRALIIGS